MKLARILLAMALIVCIAQGAMAETAPATRVGSIELEGMEEAVNEALYESPRGYRLWIDTDRFAYVEPGEGNDIDAFEPFDPNALEGVGLYINYSAQLDYTLDMAREDVEHSLAKNGYVVTEIDAKLLFPHYEAYGFHAVKDERVVKKYIIAAETGEFYLSLEYPLAAAEGFGARLWHMASTFELAKAE